MVAEQLESGWFDATNATAKRVFNLEEIEELANEVLKVPFYHIPPGLHPSHFYICRAVPFKFSTRTAAGCSPRSRLPRTSSHSRRSDSFGATARAWTRTCPRTVLRDSTTARWPRRPHTRTATRPRCFPRTRQCARNSSSTPSASVFPSSSVPASTDSDEICNF